MPTASGSISFLGAARFQGYWNASTNVATGSGLVGAVTGGLVEGLFATGTQPSAGYAATSMITSTIGHYWQVTGSGTHNVDGVTDWNLNDWCIYSGSIAGGTGKWMRVAFEDTIASIIVGDLSSSSFHMGVDNNKHVIFASGSVHSGSSNFVYDYENDRVGVGTDTPGEKVDVSLTGANGGIRVINATDNAYLKLDAPADEAAYIDFSTGESNDWQIGRRPGSNDLTIYDNDGANDYIFTWEQGGNVGIGTTNPTTLLDVNGTGRFSGDVTIVDDKKLYFGTGSYIELDATGGEEYLTISAVGEGIALTGSNVAVEGTLKVTEKIAHVGDSDTYLQFLDDEIRLVTGGRILLAAQEATQDVLYINGNLSDADFSVYANSSLAAYSVTNFKTLHISGSDGIVHLPFGATIQDNNRLTFGTTGSYISLERHVGSTGEDYLTISGSATGLVLSGSNVVIDGTLSGASPLLISGNAEQTGGGLLTDYVSNPSTLSADGVTVPESSNTVMYGPITTPDGSTFTISDSSLVKIIDLSEL